MKENNENDLISRQALYDKCVELEQEALKVVIATDDKIEKLIWNAVLTERSAFKFSVMDAPASLSNPSTKQKPKKGQWSSYKDEHCCSVCKCVVISDCWNDEIRYDYCPYCGADMSESE